MTGVGTVVAVWGPASPEERAALLSDDVERLIVEARRLGVTRRDLLRAVEGRWSDLFEDDLTGRSDEGDSRSRPRREEEERSA